MRDALGSVEDCKRSTITGFRDTADVPQSSWEARHLTYTNGHGVVADDKLNSEERADEFLLMGLRLAEGIDPRRYAALSGRALDPNRIAVLREEGAISVDPDGRLRVTKDGFAVLDAVVADLAA